MSNSDSQSKLPEKKKCRKCGRKKALSEFYPHCTACRQCVIAASTENRSKRQALDPEAFKRQRAIHDRTYQETHATEIQKRGQAGYVANRDSRLAQAKVRYARNPIPILKAALRRYRREKSKLLPGQAEFPLNAK